MKEFFECYSPTKSALQIIGFELNIKRLKNVVIISEKFLNEIGHVNKLKKELSHWEVYVSFEFFDV